MGLVAFQGAEVLDYRLVELKTGDNELAIPMTAKLAPNFDFDVAVMADTGRMKDEGGRMKAAGGQAAERPLVRFHEASSPFRVARDLRVKIAVKRKQGVPPRTVKPGDVVDPPVPGDEVEVTVFATDPQGKPVAAELSLAMIEQSLLDRFPGNLAAIQDFFQAGWRQTAVRTASSIAFADRPATQPINPRLLAEEDRVAMAAAEEASRRGFAADAAPGRLATSLRMGVTPRIAIQEEEEERLGVQTEDPFADSGAGHDHPIIYPDAAEWAQRTLARSRQGRGRCETFNRIAGPIPFMNRLFSSQQAAEGDAQLRAAAQLAAAEIAYWNPAIVTDKDGKATITLVLPERSAAWRLLAKGITADTLAGEAAETLTVQKPLFGELALPASFTDGDQTEVVASIHNNAVEKGQIEATLATTIGGRTIEEKKTVAVVATGIQKVAFAVTTGTGGRAAAETIDFALTVAAVGRKDVLRRSVPLLPYGMRVYAAATGSADADATVRVDPAEDRDASWHAAEATVLGRGATLANPALTIFVGPTIERSLLDALLAPPPACQIEVGRIASDMEAATSDLMAAVGLQKMLLGGTGVSPVLARHEGTVSILGGTGVPPVSPESTGKMPVPPDALHRGTVPLLGGTGVSPVSPESTGKMPVPPEPAQELDARIRATVSLLDAAQERRRRLGLDRGGRRQRCLGHVAGGLVLALARRAGYRVPDVQFNKAVAWLQNEIVAAADDFEAKAILLHALATVGKGDFPTANRLYRERQGLSDNALVYSCAGPGRNGPQTHGRGSPRWARRAAGRTSRRGHPRPPRGGSRGVRVAGRSRAPSGPWLLRRSRRNPRRRRSWPAG